MNVEQIAIIAMMAAIGSLFMGGIVEHLIKGSRGAAAFLALMVGLNVFVMLVVAYQ